MKRQHLLCKIGTGCRKITLGALIASFLVACATTPIPTEMASPVPQDRILENGKKLTTSSKDSGTVVVKRDTGIMGSGCSTRIYVDGAPIVDIEVGEKFSFYLIPGDYIISAQPNGICSGTMTEVKANVKAGKQSAFRFGTSGNGSPSIYPTAF